MATTGPPTPIPRRSSSSLLAGGSLLRRGSLPGALASRAHLGAVAGITGAFFNYSTTGPSGSLEMTSGRMTWSLG